MDDKPKKTSPNGNAVKFRRTLFFILYAFVPFTTVAQTVKSDAVLLDKPEGAKVGLIKGNENVSILKRQGFWAQVQTSSKSGWVKLNQLNLGGVSGLVALNTGRAGTGNIVSTSIARGLSAKDLLAGKPDASAVGRIDSWVPDPSAVDAFGSDAGLMSISLSVALKVPSIPKSGPRKGKGFADED